ncbi:MAG TPA: SOS response-associated peptidase [Dehalococcoidia bacterium]|jgi:putative SOS response-associated peptidase YedK|nr:SOS response-associated peptidase [Dehalococcoidia bacterium]
MCGRFILIDVTELGLRFRVHVTGETTPVPRFNIAPTQSIRTITNEYGTRRAEDMRWGLIPAWAKSANQIRSSFNARDDKVANSGLWKRPLARTRCLIPASGFYEWTGQKGDRKPQLIRLKGGGLMGFAGLFDTWQNKETGETVRSCAIITTGANSLMEPIHDRMPVILDAEAETLWLDPATDDPSRLTALLRPYPAEEMEAYPVSTIVNSARGDSPEMIAEMDAEEPLQMRQSGFSID